MLHTKVCWLSKGKCVRYFYNLLDTIVEFFEDTNALLSEELRADMIFLIYAEFNEMDLQLQGNRIIES